jgi:hypothetical protein
LPVSDGMSTWVYGFLKYQMMLRRFLGVHPWPWIQPAVFHMLCITPYYRALHWISSSMIHVLNSSRFTYRYLLRNERHCPGDSSIWLALVMKTTIPDDVRSPLNATLRLTSDKVSYPVAAAQPTRAKTIPRTKRCKDTLKQVHYGVRCKYLRMLWYSGTQCMSISRVSLVLPSR